MGNDFSINGNEPTSLPQDTTRVSTGVSAGSYQEPIGNYLNGSSRNQNLGSISLDDFVRELGLRPRELTDEQKAAREKLDKKVASTGIDYKNAKATLEEITKQYKDTCRSKFNSKQSETLMIYIMPHEAFDPYKIPDAKDKERYFTALAAIQEIENANSALLAQAGLKATPSPSTDYYYGPSYDEFLQNRNIYNATKAMIDLIIKIPLSDVTVGKELRTRIENAYNQFIAEQE